jgi:hypothetical protein
MKTIIIILALIFLSFIGKGQIIDTAYKASISCKVNPFLNNPRTDTMPVGRVSIDQVLFKYSNGINSMDINYTFSTLNGDNIYSGCKRIAGTDYYTVIQGIKNGYAVIFSLLGTKLNIQYQ